MRPVCALVDELAAAVPPASGAVVMGTGIVSIALSVDGREALSRSLAAIGGAVWIVLGLQLLALAARQRPLLLEQSRSPGALTGIAGTNVLGARLAQLGWNREAAALLAIGFVLWLVLVPRVLASWRRPTVGVSFVLTVATESLALLGVALATAGEEPWLAVGGIVCLGLGLVGYVFVVASFDLRELVAGAGDHWVSGGALAIATLACARSAEAVGALAPLRPAAGSLDTAALALWTSAAAWLPALLAGEAAAPRGRYDVRRWSTVFPLGMYAACSFAVARVEGIGGLERFARVWIWVAFAVWLLVFCGMARRVAATVVRSARAHALEAG